ncbi:hypothetical protein FBULB1_573 [Fusarium bulbicola]|nr:hypothetical protein FBULB1_573 [Fusarium bulbicola]
MYHLPGVFMDNGPPYRMRLTRRDFALTEVPILRQTAQKNATALADYPSPSSPFFQPSRDGEDCGRDGAVEVAHASSCPLEQLNVINNTFAPLKNNKIDILVNSDNNDSNGEGDKDVEVALTLTSSRTCQHDHHDNIKCTDKDINVTLNNTKVVNGGVLTGIRKGEWLQ